MRIMSCGCTVCSLHGAAEQLTVREALDNLVTALKAGGPGHYRVSEIQKWIDDLVPHVRAAEAVLARSAP